MNKEQEAFHTGFAALIGRPNVGKSTLMNSLIGQKVAITSNKPQTTRNQIRTVVTKPEGQIIFIDTPGIHEAKNKLGDYMVNAAEQSISAVDVILWLVEPLPYLKAGEQQILKSLKNSKIPVFLVINKMDQVNPEQILKTIQMYSGQMDFAEVYPVSALKKRNTEELLKGILKALPIGPPLYEEDTLTDQPMRQLVSEIIREKALRLMDQEIPHGIAVVVDQMKWQKKIVDIDATIICEKDSHKGMIIGKQGAMLKRIGTMARTEIETLVESQVNLKIWVKVKKDWRDSEYLLKNFGYQETDG